MAQNNLRAAAAISSLPNFAVLGSFSEKLLSLICSNLERLNRMFQNDINFVFSNLDLPVSDKEASEFLKAEIMRHEGDSVSGPYYLTKDTVEKDLPNFSFVIDSMRWPRDGQARIVIYNAYEDADRAFDQDAENVEFDVMPLFGEMKAIIGCMVEV